jgi:hypothetical protein
MRLTPHALKFANPLGPLIESQAKLGMPNARDQILSAIFSQLLFSGSASSQPANLGGHE